MNHSIFFSIESIGRDVSSNNPESYADIRTLLDLFLSLKHKDDFLGLIDKNETCLQILFGSKKYWIEVPRPDLGGSYGTYLTHESILDTLQNLPDTFPLKGLNGFEFKPW